MAVVVAERAEAAKAMVVAAMGTEVAVTGLEVAATATAAEERARAAAERAMAAEVAERATVGVAMAAPRAGRTCTRESWPRRT